MSIFIDAHVHIYSAFGIEQFFTAAFDNFLKASKNETLSDSASYVLALAEGEGYDVFSSLSQNAASFENKSEKQTGPDSLVFYKTAEPDSLLVCKGKETIALLAGRQHVSRENIEVISLLSSVKLEEKLMPLADLAQTVATNGGIVVLPWGVGKWFGGRGKIVRRFLDTAYDFPLFLGDNGNRPSFWPTPSLFRIAQEKHLPLLSGSDPLPLASHCNRVATSGTVLLDGKISSSHPAASLRKQLNGNENLREFGGRLNPVRFFYDQLRINLLSCT
ncbi:MAG: hypothetical protein BA862_14095 [Desulfobulbaceae bacterium S3730MH12]|nr:MAG: hypothetical protein BA862_14095 [Desulfobulbaceae bacterium S3730MH12]